MCWSPWHAGWSLPGIGSDTNTGAETSNGQAGGDVVIQQQSHCSGMMDSPNGKGHREFFGGQRVLPSFHGPRGSSGIWRSAAAFLECF